MSSGCLQEVKNNKKILEGRLREVPTRGLSLGKSGCFGL